MTAIAGQAPRHLCPVCRRPVTRTNHHRIQGHYDKANNNCEASFEPFGITSIEYTQGAA
jgi:hypothetical protein